MPNCNDVKDTDSHLSASHSDALLAASTSSWLRLVMVFMIMMKMMMMVMSVMMMATVMVMTKIMVMMAMAMVKDLR